jgi:hypothetical protein
LINKLFRFLSIFQPFPLIVKLHNALPIFLANSERNINLVLLAALNNHIDGLLPILCEVFQPEIVHFDHGDVFPPRKEVHNIGLKKAVIEERIDGFKIVSF